MAKTCLMVKAKRTPRFGVRGYTRCSRCGRPRSVIRKFQLCRLCFRELALTGQIPGVTKASWYAPKMSWSDPIADMLTRIRNAQKARLPEVAMPASRLKGEIARILQAEGFIGAVTHGDERRREIRLVLKYTPEGEPVIRGLRRDSRPGLRRYRGQRELPRVLGGMGLAILSTSGGVMSDKEARQRKLGGEILCSIW